MNQSELVAMEKYSLALVCGTQDIQSAMIIAEAKGIELTYDYVSNILKDALPGYNQERFTIKWDTYLLNKMIQEYENLINYDTKEAHAFKDEIDKKREDLSIRKSKLNTASST